MAFSKQAFNEFFVQKMPQYFSGTSEKIHLELSVNDLESVFGKDWYVLTNPSSTTQQRILGMVLVHFRQKTFQDQSSRR